MLKASWLLDWLLLWTVGRLLGWSCRIEAWQRARNGGIDVVWDDATWPRKAETGIAITGKGGDA